MLKSIPNFSGFSTKHLLTTSSIVGITFIGFNKNLREGTIRSLHEHQKKMYSLGVGSYIASKICETNLIQNKIRNPKNLRSILLNTGRIGICSGFIGSMISFAVLSTSIKYFLEVAKEEVPQYRIKKSIENLYYSLKDIEYISKNDEKEYIHSIITILDMTFNNNFNKYGRIVDSINFPSIPKYLSYNENNFLVLISKIIYPNMEVELFIGVSKVIEIISKGISNIALLYIENKTVGDIIFELEIEKIINDSGTKILMLLPNYYKMLFINIIHFIIK